MAGRDRLESLRELIEAYEPSDASDREGMLDLLDGAGEASLKTTYFEPGHFTAGGLVLSQDRSAVLLVFHPRFSRWMQPGGHVEDTDRHLEAAARREILEEVGLEDLESQGLIDLSVHQIPPRAEEPAHLHFDLRFGFAYRAGTPAVGDGVTDVRWVPVSELAAWQTDASVRRSAGKLLRIAGSSGAVSSPEPTTRRIKR